MISRTEKQAASDSVTQTYMDLETLIMQNIIRHVRSYEQLIDSDDWLMQMLAELGVLNEENIKIIRNAAELSKMSVEDMCYEIADTVIARIEPGLTELEREGIVKSATPVEKSENVKRAVDTVYKQAKDSLNLCNTTMLYKAQEAYQDIVRKTAEQAKEQAKRQNFLDVLGKHSTAEVVGVESRQQALRNVIKEFNEIGIPAFVDKKGRNWTPEAYVSMTLRATAGNVSTEAMFARMEDRELTLIQMSSHPGARPKCSKDQGKIFDRNNGQGTVEDLNGKKIEYYPLSSSSYGDPDGILGINCGHHGIPFIPGISRQRYFPTKDFKENDALYKKMQKQRALERDIRRKKRLCMLYNEAGDKDAFEEASVKLKSKEAALGDYVKKNKLLRRKDRETVVGFDRSVSANAVGKAQTRYKRWAKSIGAESGPKNLAGYYDLKYNDNKESRLYKGYVTAVNKGNISPLVGYDTFKAMADNVEKQFVGIQTSDGMEIKGFTAHFVDRVIGQRSHDSPSAKGIRLGVDLADIEDALRNPKNIGPVVEKDNGRRSKVYYGTNAAVSYNPDTGELVQVQPKRTK